MKILIWVYFHERIEVFLSTSFINQFQSFLGMSICLKLEIAFEESFYLFPFFEFFENLSIFHLTIAKHYKTPLMFGSHSQIFSWHFPVYTMITSMMFQFVQFGQVSCCFLMSSCQGHPLFHQSASQVSPAQL